MQAKALIGLYLVVSLYVIKETQAQQGFLVLVFGIGVVIGLYLVQLNRALSVTYGILSVLASSLFSLELLTKVLLHQYYIKIQSHTVEITGVLVGK